jgi:myo-inositol-1(or 4)-monophosphatase
MNDWELRQSTINIAQEAGVLLFERLGHHNRVEHKGVVDLVTEADKASERLLVERLHALLPEASILAEEGSGSQRASGLRWIVDPLDGTTNYAHGYPVFSVSIALERDGGIVLGVVLDPTRNECFTALRGHGAFLNGKPIQVSATPDLDAALLVTGFPYDVRTTERDNLIPFRRFLKTAQAIRRGGSAALDLCYVACGRFDGYWEESLSPWDIAAGVLIVQEAKGRVTGYLGGAPDVESGHIIATNGRIHESMQSILTEIEGKAGLPPLETRRFRGPSA